MPPRQPFDFNDLDPEETAALFDASPALETPVSLRLPTERMRQAERSRNRLPPVEEDPQTIRERELRAEERERAQEIPSLIQLQHQEMRRLFALSGVTLASIQLEMLGVARAAAANNEFQAAGGIYKTIAQTLGAIEGDKHLHVHNTINANTDPARLPDLRATTDQALYQLIERAKQEQLVIEAPAVQTAPIEESRAATEPQQP